MIKRLEAIELAAPTADQIELAAVAERLEALDAAADRILESTTPPNTAAAFAGDWAHWEKFCANEGLPPTTVSASLFVAFATWLAVDTPDRPAQAPATIARRLSGVLDGMKRRKLDIPHGITAGARKVIRAYAKDLAQRGLPLGRGPAAALTIRDMRRLSEALPDTLAGVRDRAIITLGFAIAGRRSEIAALTIPDVTAWPGGLKVRIRDSKTGERWPAVRPGTSLLTCPIQAWNAWLDASGITAGPAFRPIDRHGNLRQGALAGSSIGGIVARAGLRVGLKLSGHSLRSGLATEARRAGHDAKTIAKQGGWKPNSAVLYGYMQIVDEWTDNATEGLGL